MPEHFCPSILKGKYLNLLGIHRRGPQLKILEPVPILSIKRLGCKCCVAEVIIGFEENVGLDAVFLQLFVDSDQLFFPRHTQKNHMSGPCRLFLVGQTQAEFKVSVSRLDNGSSLAEVFT